MGASNMTLIEAHISVNIVRFQGDLILSQISCYLLSSPIITLNCFTQANMQQGNRYRQIMISPSVSEFVYTDFLFVKLK